MTRFTKRLIGFVGAGSLLLCGVVRADEVLQINDLTEGNTTLTPGVGNPNSGIVAGTVVEKPEHLSFEYTWFQNAPGVIPQGTTDSVGMDDPVTGKLSDVLQWFSSNDANSVTYHFDFYSDDENGNLPMGAILTNHTSNIDENGTFQTLGFFGFSPDKMELQAASDVETPAPVSAWGLLILLAGLGFWRQRRTRLEAPQL